MHMCKCIPIAGSRLVRECTQLLSHFHFPWNDGLISAVILHEALQYLRNNHSECWAGFWPSHTLKNDTIISNSKRWSHWSSLGFYHEALRWSDLEIWSKLLTTEQKQIHLEVSQTMLNSINDDTNVPENLDHSINIEHLLGKNHDPQIFCDAVCSAKGPELWPAVI